MANQPRIPISGRDARRVARRAGVDPRTVLKRFRSQRQSDGIRQLIDDALRELGLPLPDDAMAPREAPAR